MSLTSFLIVPNHAVFLNTVGLLADVQTLTLPNHPCFVEPQCKSETWFIYYFSETPMTKLQSTYTSCYSKEIVFLVSFDLTTTKPFWPMWSTPEVRERGFSTFHRYERNRLKPRILMLRVLQGQEWVQMVSWPNPSWVIPILVESRKIYRSCE